MADLGRGEGARGIAGGVARGSGAGEWRGGVGSGECNMTLPQDYTACHTHFNFLLSFSVHQNSHANLR